MSEVMSQLDAAHDDLLDKDDKLVGRVKDVKEVEKRLQHKLLHSNAWRLIPFFELFMSALKTSYIRGKSTIYMYIHVQT